MKLLNKYYNGNNLVKIYEDGTKIRETYDTYICTPLPESMDLKITNKCFHNCSFCHECSHPKGKHADIKFLKELLNPLRPGQELALGGGNVLLYPELKKLLEYCKERGLVPSITTNSKDLIPIPYLKNDKYDNDIVWYQEEGLIYGVGISYNSDMDWTLIKHLDNVVFHLISGIHTIKDVKEICKHVAHPKILWLGYKQKGRGKTFYNKEVENNIKQLNKDIIKIMDLGFVTVCFDNLSIDQLNIKDKIPKSEWDKLYMGDEGQYTMYIDAVEEKFAKSSVEEKQFDCKDKNLYQIFKEILDQRFLKELGVKEK